MEKETKPKMDMKVFDMMLFNFEIESRIIKKFYGNMSRILRIMFKDFAKTYHNNSY